MTRFHAVVGYADSEEASPGVWKDIITEVDYSGEVVRDFRRLDSPLDGQTLNDDISVQNSFSILADAYANENFTKMRYITWNGSNWTITGVEAARPRLILTVGGLWNGDTA